MGEYRKVGFKDVRLDRTEGIWGFVTMRKRLGGGRLEGVKLKEIVEALVAEIGWNRLAVLSGVRAFELERKPTVKSALKFLRDNNHNWARTKVERLYEQLIQ